MIEPITNYSTISRIDTISPHDVTESAIDEQQSIITKAAPKIKSKASSEYFNAHVGAYCKPKASCDKRTHPTGEDAYMFACNEDITAIGVADGVGGWAEYNVDPSIVSIQLMQNCKSLLLNKSSERSSMDLEQVEPLPKQMLIDAYSMLFTQRQVEAGSTTACIVTIDSQLQLSYANLGDSGFIVVRPTTGETVFRSKEQQHYFNAPYQLAVIPQSIYQLCDPSLLLTDSPHDANSTENIVQLQEGDVIVLASDGLFDNLFDHEIINVIQSTYSDQDHSRTCRKLAKKLVHLAQSKFLTEQPLEHHTPFSLGAEQFLLSTGAIAPDQCIAKQGKHDDVTCVVCVVKSLTCTTPVNHQTQTD